MKGFAVLLVSTIRAFIGLGRLLAYGLASLFERIEEWAKAPGSARALARATPEPARIPVRSPSAPQRPVPAAAHQIFQIAFVESGWKAYVFVYLAEADRRAVRVLKPATTELEEQLRYCLAQTKFELPEVSLKDVSVEAVLRDTEVTALQVIKDLQQKMRNVQRQALDAKPDAASSLAAATGRGASRQVAGPAATEAYLSMVRAEQTHDRESQQGQPKGNVVPLKAPTAPQAPASPFSSPTLARKGKAYRGTVTELGERPSTFGEGKTTFTLSVRTADEVKDFRGSELRRLCQQLTVKVGDLVEITPLGKKAVPGKTGTLVQNCFDVVIVGRGPDGQAAA